MSAEGAGAEKPKKIRAFVALKVPDWWEAALTELQTELKAAVRSKAFKWTKPEQMHITLRFLGYIVPEAAAAIMERVQEEIVSRHGSFVLRCEGLGCFPNVRRPRVLWAGITGDTAALGRLHESVTAATRTFGEPPEERAFNPHLTLARIQQTERSAIDSMEKMIARGFSITMEWNVNELILMQSHLSPQGATYEAIARWPLG